MIRTPKFLPHQQEWIIEERDDQGVLLQSIKPNSKEAAWLKKYPTRGLDLCAERELIENRKLLSDPIVIEALKNLRNLRS